MDRESTGPVPFCSFAPLSHHLPQGLPCPCWTPSGWVPLGVGTLSLPQPPLRVRPLLLLPLPSLPLPQDPRGWRGPQWAEDQTWDLNRFLGVQVGRGNLATLPFDPLPSQQFPIAPCGHGIPSPPPAASQGHQSSPSSTSLPSLPQAPHPTRCWGFLLSPWASVVPHQCLVGALVLKRCKFHVLLVRHVDSTPQNP